MKLFKCCFELDTGYEYLDLVRYVFASVEDKKNIQKLLEKKMCIGYDEMISDLKIIEVIPFEGLVI